MTLEDRRDKKIADLQERRELIKGLGENRGFDIITDYLSKEAEAHKKGLLSKNSNLDDMRFSQGVLYLYDMIKAVMDSEIAITDKDIENIVQRQIQEEDMIKERDEYNEEVENGR